MASLISVMLVFESSKMIFSVASSGLSSAKLTPGIDWAAELAAMPELAQVMPGTLNFIVRSAARAVPLTLLSKSMLDKTRETASVVCFMNTPSFVLFIFRLPEAGSQGTVC
ncbi:MAG: hypothetical protein EPN25_08285 [Nitrospirae bacterium]|nr:MAG: hypothetical protein EPN25_08285 [Nitrospirota bacterium]